MTAVRDPSPAPSPAPAVGAASSVGAAAASDRHRQVSVVLAVNDLEATRIRALALERGCDVRALDLDWGVRIDPNDPRLQDLQPTVLLVELPNPAFEDKLRAEGKVVQIVDHHLTLGPAGQRLDRRRPRSSLEQVAALLDALPLGRRDRLVSANDRGFIPTLARQGLAEGVPPDGLAAEVRALRLDELAIRFGDAACAAARLEAALAWVRTAEARGRLRRFGTDRTDPDDPHLILVHAPEEHAACINDALAFWRHEQGTPLTQRLTSLVLTTATDAPDAAATGLFFSGRAEHRGVVDALLDRLCGDDARGGRLTLWAGGGGGPADGSEAEGGCFLGARDTLGTEAAALDRLADRILAETLTGNRPVLSWRSHFLQTLRLGAPLTLRPGQTRFRPEAPSPAHRAYFLGHVRDLLVPTADGPAYADPGPGPDPDPDPDQCGYLRSYLWPAPPMRLQVRQPGRRQGLSWQATLPLRAVRIHTFINGLAVIEWACAGGLPGFDRAGPDALAYAEADTGAWRQLLAIDAAFDPDSDGDSAESRGDGAGDRADSDVPGLRTVARVLDFNRACRHTGSPYRNPDDSVLVDLLDADGRSLGALRFGEAVTEGIDGWFAALLAGLGEAVTLTEPRLVFDERARVVSGLAVAGGAPETEAGQTQLRVTLARLRGIDDYDARHFYDPAFAEAELSAGWYRRFAGPGTHYLVSDHSFTVYAHGWFAPRFILPDHLPNLYRRLFLIALLYAATLNRFAQDASEASLHPIPEQRQRFRRLLTAFVRFANGLWFETVSSQVQGQELFALIREAQPIRADYAEVKAEIERTDALMAAIKEEEDRQETKLIEGVGAVGLVLAIATGALGMNLIDGTAWPIWQRVATFCAVAAGLGVLVGGVLWRHRRRRTRSLAEPAPTRRRTVTE